MVRLAKGILHPGPAARMIEEEGVGTVLKVGDGN